MNSREGARARAPARAPARAQAAPDVVGPGSAELRWLEGLFDRLPEASWVSLLQVCRQDSAPAVRSLGVCPAHSQPALAVRPLAVRCALSARLVHVGDADPELLAIPLASLASTTSGEQGSHVLVMGLKAVDASRRAAIARLCLDFWSDKNEYSETAQRLTDPQTPPKPPKPPAIHAAESDSARLAHRISHVLMLATIEQKTHDDLVLVLVNELVRALGAERVTLARVHHGRAYVLAMSGQTQVDTRRNLGASLLRVLDHALDCGRSEAWPPADQSGTASGAKGVDESRAQLFSLNGGMPFVTVVLDDEADSRSALLLEWPVGKTEWIDRVDAVCQLIDPALRFLQSRSRASEGGIARFRRQLRMSRLGSLHSILPPRAWLLLVCSLLLLLAHVIHVPLRVTARAAVEALDRQIISAPQDGFLKSATVRAGDRVQRGDVLAALDDQELLLSISRWQADLRRNADERNRALAVRDRVELGKLRASEQRLLAEFASATAALERAELRAPFDALILRGEPGQSLGAPISAGDVLFEIASDDGYRLMLEVQESDVALVQRGQEARVRMSAMPSEQFQARLAEVLPVAIEEQGGSVFRLPATLDDDAILLRPGMQGVARIDVGRDSILRVYTRSLWDRVRLLAWRFGLLA